MIENILLLVKTEYKKYRKNIVAQLLLGTFAVFAPFLILVGKRLFKYAEPPFPSPLSLFEFPMIWDYQGYLNQHLIYVLLGFFVIYSVTTEISNKTLRQNIITGYTKKEFFLAKFFSYVLISLIASGIFFLSSMLLGWFHTDGVDIALMLDNRWLTLRYFLCCMGFMTFALFISLWVKRSGLAIFIYFGYIVIVEQMLRGLFIYFTDNFEWSRLFPMNVYEDLLPNPLYRIEGFLKIFDDREIKLLLEQEYAIGLSVMFIFLFTWLAWWIFKNRDV